MEFSRLSQPVSIWAASCCGQGSRSEGGVGVGVTLSALWSVPPCLCVRSVRDSLAHSVPHAALPRPFDETGGASRLDSRRRQRLRSVVLGARVTLAGPLQSPRPRSGGFRTAVRSIHRPRSGQFIDHGAVDSATAVRSFPRPGSGHFRDRGAVDEIAVGRARASATSPRVTRDTAGRTASTAERSNLQSHAMVFPNETSE
jgi:hypothetical protein